jgi:histidine kinase 2/3/4 (cytokinin receptor)
MGGKYCGARRKKGWRGLAAAAWLLMAVACSAVMHWHLRRENFDRAEERLVSMCEERARMLQEQFGVTVNHVHALAILISTFHYEKFPSAIDQVRHHLPSLSTHHCLLLLLLCCCCCCCIKSFSCRGGPLRS